MERRIVKDNHLYIKRLLTWNVLSDFQTSLQRPMIISNNYLASTSYLVKPFVPNVAFFYFALSLWCHLVSPVFHLVSDFPVCSFLYPLYFNLFLYLKAIPSSKSLIHNVNCSNILFCYILHDKKKICAYIPL